MFSIRKALPEDVDAVSRLFRKTIKTVNAKDYDPVQLNAWSAKYENRDWWMDCIRSDYFLIVEEQFRILGFCSVSPKGSLDLIYVHKDFQGNGVGRALMGEVDKYFAKLGIREITSEVSITAKPFFMKMGFENTQRQKKVVNGVEVMNYIMRKKVYKKSACFPEEG